MDPNSNLIEQLAIARQIVADVDAEQPAFDWPFNAVRMAELVIALDEWIRKGGFLPDGWSKGGKR